MKTLLTIPCNHTPSDNLKILGESEVWGLPIQVNNNRGSAVMLLSKEDARKLRRELSKYIGDC